jgi:solute:Na+ symporter, SSS family
MLFAVSPPRTGLVPLDYVGVAVYLVVTVAIVVWASRRQKNTEDFFLGGRTMPWLAVGMSLLATLLSTNSYLGVPGEMVRSGVALFAGYMSVPLSMCVVLLVWVPFFMRLRMTSAYEYLENRFGYGPRLLAGVLFFLLRMGWISMVMYTASMALSRMTHIPQPWVIAAVGAAAVVYTSVGGIRAVIWNDVLQFVMLFGGAIVTIGYVMWATGEGPLGWWNAVGEQRRAHVTPQFFSFDITVRFTIVTAIANIFFWTICTHGSDQVVLQRYFSTTSLSAARRSYIVNAISEVAIGLLLALSGLALLRFYLRFPDWLPGDLSLQKSADQVFPYFFSHQLPAGLGGLILAGFLCDAMQTLVSGVNSVTAVATKDVFERLYPQGQRWLNELTLARIVTVALGITVTLLAEAVAYLSHDSGLNIIDLMPKTFNMFLGPLASLFLIGMFLPRCGGKAAVTAVLLALLLAITWNYWGDIPGMLRRVGLTDAAASWQSILGTNDQGRPKTPTISLSTGLPYLTSFCVAAVLATVFRACGLDQRHGGRDYNWFAVMRRPVPQPGELHRAEQAANAEQSTPGA